MASTGTVSKLESGVFRIAVRNGRVLLPDKEYDVHHVYVVGAKGANISFKDGRITADFECDKTPIPEYQDEVLSIFCSDHPAVSRNYVEELESGAGQLKGFTKPLSMRITEELEYFITITVNEKHVYKASELALKASGESIVVNMVSYPMKIVWIYVPEARIELVEKEGFVEIKISGA